MKYLQLYDHNGNLVMEHNVYVEGGDFSWTAEKPTAVWLGTILLSDKKLEALEPVPEEKVIEAAGEVEVVPEPEPELPSWEVEEQRQLEADRRETRFKCSECGWEGTRSETSFGHDDYICPTCRVESLEEIKLQPVEEVKRVTKRVRKTSKRHIRTAPPDAS